MEEKVYILDKYPHPSPSQIEHVEDVDVAIECDNCSAIGFVELKLFLEGRTLRRHCGVKFICSKCQALGLTRADNVIPSLPSEEE